MLSLRITNSIQKTHTSSEETYQDGVGGWPHSMHGFRVAIDWPYGKRPAVCVCSSQWYGSCV